MASPLTFNPNTQYWDWSCPPAAAPDYKIVGWLNEAVEQGQSWLKNQRTETDFRKALDVISGIDGQVNKQSADYRSRVNPNRLKRNIREVVGAMAKLRPKWGYHADNKAYKSVGAMFDKIFLAIYLEQQFDLRIKDALRYAAATARGWACPVYRRNMFGTGRGAIEIDTYGSPCVLPVQLPSDGNFQNAYAVTILKELGVAMAHGMFPLHQASLVPTESRYWYMHDAVRHSTKANVWQRMAGKIFRQPGSEALADLLIPIRYTYVIDLAINTTKDPIVMGEPGSSWSYTVPPLKSDIPVGRDPKSGTVIYRKADESDSRLYPYRRLLIASDTTKLYDGPSFDWHGMFPGVSFCLDAWPWEPLGFSMVHDAYELNESIKESYRGNMDKLRAQLDMSLAYDTNAISEKEAQRLDPMMPRGRYGYDGNATEPGKPPFTPIVPENVVKIDPTSIEFTRMMEQAMDNQVALTDVVTLAKMRAVGSMDEIEKVMEANGPIVEEMSRSMEAPMRDLGTMVKYLILQYMTVPRAMQYVGADGVAEQVFDYDPTSLIPSHIPGENPEEASPSSKVARARNLADNLRFLITPNTLHEMAQMTFKLGLIQLKKAGAKIDSATLVEPWGISNYGDFDGDTVIEKWEAEQEYDLRHAARLAEIGAAAGLGQPPGAAAPGKNPEGRPATNAKPPKIENKEGGARSTISTSG